MKRLLESTKRGLGNQNSCETTIKGFDVKTIEKDRIRRYVIGFEDLFALRKTASRYDLPVAVFGGVPGTSLNEFRIKFLNNLEWKGCL